MNVRAKFQCTTISKQTDGSELVYFMAATDDSNKDWSKYTPAGSLQMTISQEGAIGQFEQSKEYFLNFTPADA